jgi:hypothetical protein
MKYRLTPSLNDGKRDAPPFEVEAKDANELADAVFDAITNDHRQPFGVGFTLHIERTA